MASTPSAQKKLSRDLCAFALGLPGAYEDHPWGEIVAKVNKKVFVFFGTPEGNAEGFGMGVKLPASAALALELPFVEPAGYGLGKSGWVTVKFRPGELPPAALLKEWIVESYRAVAPKKLAAALAPAELAPAKKPRARAAAGKVVR
ncbi:MAG: MmcQ/YjbR family DNA-binding protein [Myxococcales bacterium]|nr:MmcQ/YjbR family DNA-binding protein [Myxococcales bacterium]